MREEVKKKNLEFKKRHKEMRETNKFGLSQEEFRSGLERGMRVYFSVVVLNFFGSLFSRKRYLVHACNITFTELSLKSP